MILIHLKRQVICYMSYYYRHCYSLFLKWAYIHINLNDRWFGMINMNSRVLATTIYRSDQLRDPRMPDWSIKPIPSIRSYFKSAPSNKFRGNIVAYEQVEAVESKFERAVFFPETCPTLSFYCGPSTPFAYFVGPITKPVTFTSMKKGTYFFVTFSPGQLFPLSLIPLNTIRNTWIPTDQLMSFDWDSILATISQAKNFFDRVMIWESYFSEFYRWNKKIVPSWIHQAIKFISNHSDQCSDKQLSKYLGYSNRHIRNEFYKYAGISPRTFIRTVKYKRALYYLSRDPNQNMSALSQDLGYYDQSHFINEFSNFTGLTPFQFIVQYLTT